MANVGFYGGSTVRELGPASDMRAFFGCVQLAVDRLPSGDGGLLTDRLYRRYLRLDELERAKALLSQVNAILAGIPTESLDWKSLGRDPSSTTLDLSSAQAANTLHRYFVGVEDIVENAQSFEKRFKVYKPVMTIISDTRRFLIDSGRPLADYDSLEGEPLWLR